MNIKRILIWRINTMFLFNQTKIHTVFTALLVLPLFAVSYTAHAQMGGGVFAYPDAGQSQAQQQKDQFECHNWSAQQTGFDPNRVADPRTQTYSYGQRSSQGRGFGSGNVGEGAVIGDGMRGAASGALIWAMTGNVKKGAKIGAASGALFGGIRRNKRRREEDRYNQQVQAQAQARQQNDIASYDQAKNGYQHAYRACMSAKDYVVK